jgi:hypothetical protein
MLKNQQTRIDLGEMIHRLWSTESFGTLPNVKLPVSKDNARALKLLEDNVTFTGERYEAPLLWTTDHPDLPDNYAVALVRFQSLDKSLKRNSAKAKAYELTITDYINQGHARKLGESEVEGPIGRTWYLPHHAVFNPSSVVKMPRRV